MQLGENFRIWQE